MRRCRDCGLESADIALFASSPKMLYHRLNLCRDCAVRRQRRIRGGRTEFIRDLKRGPCTDCGGTFPPECMDFDHRPGEEKLFELSKGGAKTEAAILDEIAKCDLVCANCHRIRSRQRWEKKMEVTLDG